MIPDQYSSDIQGHSRRGKSDKAQQSAGYGDTKLNIMWNPGLEQKKDFKKSV